MKKRFQISKIKLTKYEQWIEDHADEFVPASKEELERFKRALEAAKQNYLLNPNLPQNVRMANAALAESNIEVLRNFSKKLTPKTKKTKGRR